MFYNLISRIYDLLKKSKENSSKRILEEKDKTEFYFLFSLGIPYWLRKKLWPIMIGNKSSINENIFNYYLRQVEEVDFSEISKSIQEKYQKNEVNSQGKNVFFKKAKAQMIDFNKTVKKIEVNFTSEPLLNEIIIDIVNISLKFDTEIESYKIEIFTLQKELFEIIRIFCMSRPDVTYSKQITYIAFFLYLNSENYYMTFVNLSNLIVSTHLIKFLTNDEIYVKIKLKKILILIDQIKT